MEGGKFNPSTIFRQSNKYFVVLFGQKKKNNIFRYSNTCQTLVRSTKIQAGPEGAQLKKEIQDLGWAKTLA